MIIDRYCGWAANTELFQFEDMFFLCDTIAAGPASQDKLADTPGNQGFSCHYNLDARSLTQWNMYCSRPLGAGSIN